MAFNFLSKFKGLFGGKAAPKAKTGPWWTKPTAQAKDTRPGPGCIDVSDQKK
jgi:hypothetical protein